MVRCVTPAGKEQYRAEYLFRRSAVEDAGRLSSVLYDVLVEDRKGRHRPLIWPHTPPQVLLARLDPDRQP